MLEAISGVALLSLLLGAALFGFLVQARLPEHHRSRETIEVTQLVMSLLVTFAALVLGLLTTSVKNDYDTAEHDRVQFAAQLTQLDRCMRNYGPGAEPMRQQLKAYTAAVIASTWPEEPHPTGVDYPDASRMQRTGPNLVLADLMNTVGVEIRKLDALDPTRRVLADDCADTYKDVLRSRWAVIEDVYSTMSYPFYGAVVFWLAIIFAGFGLRAPANATTGIVVLLGAASVTSALVLVLDLNLPYEGFFHIPSTAMRFALDRMVTP